MHHIPDCVTGSTQPPTLPSRPHLYLYHHPHPTSPSSHHLLPLPCPCVQTRMQMWYVFAFAFACEHSASICAISTHLFTLSPSSPLCTEHKWEHTCLHSHSRHPCHHPHLILTSPHHSHPCHPSPLSPHHAIAAHHRHPLSCYPHHLIILSCRSNGTMCELHMLCHHSCTLSFACPFLACTHRYTYLHRNWIWVWTVWVPLDLHTCPKIHTPHARAFTGNHHHYSRSFIEHFTTYLYPTLLVVVFSLCQ